MAGTDAAAAIHTYILTYIHTYIPTYIHTYIHTYTHTYIHTHIHTYIQHILTATNSVAPFPCGTPSHSHGMIDTNAAAAE